MGTTMTRLQQCSDGAGEVGRGSALGLGIDHELEDSVEIGRSSLPLAGSGVGVHMEKSCLGNLSQGSEGNNSASCISKAS